MHLSESVVGYRYARYMLVGAELGLESARSLRLEEVLKSIRRPSPRTAA